MELLAPVGNLENFMAAMDAGADAVYVGAPGFNARNLSRDLRFEEISGMLSHCRRNGVQFYLAANSLLIESELPNVIENLAFYEELKPDALIVQDCGLIRLIREYFPAIPVHASTLMAAHSVESISTLHSMGCERVVLAREMTMDEIHHVCRKSPVELEVFVHGAMCYSYSGLCLFSSYFGGKSGLRGRCVQPCRRGYSYRGRPVKHTKTGKKSRPANRRGTKSKTPSRVEYTFSMNDLGALSFVPELQAAGVASLKIEGRLRSAQYVYNVVKGYRTAIDGIHNDFDSALEKAQEYVDHAMSRKVTSGYFGDPRPKNAITPFHSGNIGKYLGRLLPHANKKEGTYFIKLKAPLEVGDRVRMHEGKSQERKAFTIKELLLGKKRVEKGGVDQQVTIVVDEIRITKESGKVDLYKVDSVSGRSEVHGERLSIDGRKESTKCTQIRNKVKKRVQFVRERTCFLSASSEDVGGKGVTKDKKPHSRKMVRHQKMQRGRGHKSPLEIWLRTDSFDLLKNRMVFTPDRMIINISDKLVRQAGVIKRNLGALAKSTIWALPPIIHDADLPRMKKLTATLMRNGFRSFQIGHLGQGAIFEGQKKIKLHGDYTLNLLNSQAVRCVAEMGLESGQLCIESDRAALQSMLIGYKKIGIPTPKGGETSITMKTGLTLFGRPALYTSRLQGDHFQLERTLVSPKNESFVIKKQGNLVVTLPEKPFSLLPYQRELKGSGLDYGVIDLCGMKVGKKEFEDIYDRLLDTGKYARLSTFNYLGKLE